MNNVSENPNIFGTKCEHTQQNENVIFGGNHLGMFDMRKFRYRYTGKNIPVIPVFWPCKKLSFIGSSES